MTKRTIPKSRVELRSFSARALAGALSLGETLGLAQNTAVRIAADQYDLFGEPGSLTNLGKQAALNARRDDVTEARAVRRLAIQAGREFISTAVDMLKRHLGRSWNPNWIALGFTEYSIATSGINPLLVLDQVRAYLVANPTREVSSEGLTAAAAAQRIAAIEAAESDLDTAITARKDAVAQRDAATTQLRNRLSGLREELDQLLSASDVRWYEFGFSRPIDEASPASVTELTATPGQAGEVLLRFAPSARALDYRVRWYVLNSSGDPVDVGLFADTAVLLTGLPSGATVVVGVSARNASGETPATEITVVVP